MCSSTPKTPTYTFLTFQGRSRIGSVSFGGFHLNGPGVPELRELDCYALVYPTNGKARYSDDKIKNQLVQAGDLMLLFPGKPHMYLPDKREYWTEFWLLFSGPAFDLWRDAGIMNPDAPITRLLPIDYWYRRFEVILEMDLHGQQHNALERICALQRVLAESFGNESAVTPVNEDHLWLERALSYLDVGNLSRAPSLEDIAEEMDMSYDQFRRRFTALSGITPGHYRAARVISRACEMMEREKLTNRELADRCGFSSEFHFSRRFKQIVGLTPTEFRKQSRKSKAAANQSSEMPPGPAG